MPININGTTGISGVDGSAATPALQGTDTNTGISFGSDVIIGSTGGVERWRTTSSGQWLVGTSTANNNLRIGESFAVVNTTADYGGACLTSYCGSSNPVLAPVLDFQRSRGTSDGSFSAVGNGDTLGYLNFRGSTGSGFENFAAIVAQVDGAVSGTGDCPGRLVFLTSPDGSSNNTERMRINSSGNLSWGAASPSGYPGVNFLASNGLIVSQTTYGSGTASAANLNIASDGVMYRSTSSIKYKTNIESIEDFYSDALLNCRPVWYQSTCEADNPRWGYWGFIAEEVAAIDPRLCFFKENADGTLEPEGVQYDRFVPHLLNLIKRQQQAIEDLQAEVAALKTA